MAASTPFLDLLIVDSHDPRLLVVGDSSIYPSGWNVVSPTLGITVPGYPEKQIPFIAQGINLLNSNTLGITCDVENCALSELPDGVYTVKYAIAPAYLYNVTKTFLRTNRIQKRYDEKFLTIEMCSCDIQMRKNQRMMQTEIEDYIQGAISAANKCAIKLALELYHKASHLIDNFTNSCNVKW